MEHQIADTRVQFDVHLSGFPGPQVDLLLVHRKMGMTELDPM
jgi:hypothetical protein